MNRMNFFTTGIFTLFIGVSALFSQQLSVRPGSYKGALQLNETTRLPVRVSVEVTAKKKHLFIHNASERIELTPSRKKGDTLVLTFPNFDSELRVIQVGKQHLSGYWINFNRAGNYTIPFEATLVQKEQPTDKPTIDLSGKWDSYFSPKTKEEEKTVGIFQQQDKTITGTILTETGDYRFLEGIVEGNHFYLSCFDGSHAFMLTGALANDAITGTFFSGKHYQTSWAASRNEQAKLGNADSLTRLKAESSPVNFTLKDLSGKDYTFPNAATKNKVVILQIMGTWCPNCMDETNYYKELYAKYHSQGLEIISIGYEAADTFEQQAAKIQRLKERHQLDFTFLVGGKANKSVASQQFAMLNEVISFPTSIYIGRDGLVKRIHTGFNGPGTGAYYTEYVEKTNALIEELLAK